MEVVKLSMALTIIMIVLMTFATSGTMAQEFGPAAAPSPTTESAGMALPMPAVLAAIVSLATFTDILKQLAKRFNMDLTSRKASIKFMFQDELTKLADEENEYEPDKTEKGQGVEA